MPLLRRQCLPLLAAGPLLARAGDEKPGQPVQLAVDAKYPPFMYLDEARGHARGVYPVLLRAVFERLQVPVKITPLPWLRALAGLESGAHGVAGIYANPERLAKYDYSKPLLVETVRLYSQRGHLSRFDRMDDLRGLRVGVLRGWTYGTEFDAARRAGWFAVEEVVDDRANFGKMERDRIDVALGVEQSCEPLLRSGEFPSVRALPNPLIEQAAHVAFLKSLEQRPLLARIVETIARMRYSGEHTRLVIKGLQD